MAETQHPRGRPAQGAGGEAPDGWVRCSRSYSFGCRTLVGAYPSHKSAPQSHQCQKRQEENINKRHGSLGIIRKQQRTNRKRHLFEDLVPEPALDLQAKPCVVVGETNVHCLVGIVRNVILFRTTIRTTIHRTKIEEGVPRTLCALSTARRSQNSTPIRQTDRGEVHPIDEQLQITKSRNVPNF